ncbi:hypothetical protein [Dactylosporangium sp. NPDC000521]|uniref:hypothetical protein n=1 Tax=Dactylosporangium sp. NPDC000521 TaxID=3363975 RepID=UPI0036AD4351
MIHPRTFSLLIPEGARQHAACWLTGAILLGMSSHDAYAEPERGRTLTVVLLALLILTVIGALFGFVLGRQDIDDPKSNAGDGQSSRPVDSVTSQAAPKGTPCPPFMEAGVKDRDAKAVLPLTLQLYIRTDRHEVWICLEADGNGLWYQGHDKRKSFSGVDGSGETPIEGDNGLLVASSNVTNAGVDKYLATNEGTRYTVSRDKLVIEGKQTSSEEVRESLPKK